MDTESVIGRFICDKHGIMGEKRQNSSWYHLVIKDKPYCLDCIVDLADQVSTLKYVEVQNAS